MMLLYKSGSGDGVSPGVLDTVFQRQTAEVSEADIRNGEGGNLGFCTKIK